MRKLVHEEVGKEAVDKSINIAVRLSKPTLKEFMKALKFAVGKPTKAVGKAIGEKIHPTKGKQSVKTLIRQGQGVSSIPLADEGLKDFQKIAKKYGVDFAVVKDKNEEPPVYTIFFKAKDTDVITKILQDYSEKQVKKKAVERPSVLEKLKKLQALWFLYPAELRQEFLPHLQKIQVLTVRLLLKQLQARPEHLTAK